MKLKSLRKKPYSALMRKLFLQTLILFFAAIAFFLIIRVLTSGRISNAIVSWVSSISFLGISYARALNLFQIYIRSNYDIIFMVIVIVCFLIFFRILLSWFTKYFDQIVNAVDLLDIESDEEIRMTDELGFMEVTLNEAKHKLKRRSDEAAEAQRRKDELVMYLAHDIKTPLTSVMGYLSLLEEASDMPQKQREKYTKIALEKSQRLEELINEFFEITRYNQNMLVLNKSNVNLNLMLEQLADELFPQLTEQSKQIVFEINEDVELFCDAEKMARVFNNVLKNAVNYSGSKSTINIIVRQKTDETKIIFENDGEINAVKLDNLFEKFYRLDAARSSATGGAGLGLAIAKDIVEAHGGSIKAESENGKTRFIILLPSKA